MEQTFVTAKIISNRLIGDAVRHLTVQPERQLDYEAGQFFLMRLRDDKGDYVERSYSASNFSNRESGIEFVIRIDPSGHLSPLVGRLAVGDTVDLKGPFGRFGLAMAKDLKKLVLIAGGVGISPIRSIIQKSFSLNEAYPIQLFYGFRNDNDFLFREELQKYASSGRLELVTTVSTNNGTRAEHGKGYIHLFLENRIFKPEAGVDCFICGPPAMVKETREKLLTLGFERGQIHLEAW
ncbi:MAG: FAD-binding oxidoreductase [bacterium]|nr:FAD-binding oxidoreductase [bacterium]